MSASNGLPKGIRLMRGRFQARIRHEGRDYVTTWDTEAQAVGWQKRTRRELAAGTHAGQQVVDPQTAKPLPPLFSVYAAAWVAERDLKPRTRSEYRRMLPHLEPLNRFRLDQLTRPQLTDWHRKVKAPPTHKAHIYALCRSILNTAVAEGLIDVNPCLVPNAGKVKRRSRTDIPTATEVQALADAMPSAKYRTMTLVAAWCGLRFGEVTELRRGDVVQVGGQPVRLRVRRAVVRVDGDRLVGDPKSDAGVRDVTIPPHIRPDLTAYLTSIGKAHDTLLFPGSRTAAHMAPSSLYRVFYAARDEVGLPTLRWHDLRHFSATTAAQTGATIAELMARIGHSTAAAALRYQHAASGRDEVIAEAMSNVIVLKPKPAPVEDDLPLWLSVGGVWHMAGDSDAYCGRTLRGHVEEVRAADAPGRVCGACSARWAHRNPA